MPCVVYSSKLFHSIFLVADLLLHHLQGGSPTIAISLETVDTMTIIPTATGQTFTDLTITVARLLLVTTAQDHQNLVCGTTPLDGHINDLLRVHHRGIKIVAIP